ncbi:MAG: MBL fold metallo-hydrolase [Promethearchaeota archaeon]|nr:MAG: MBL fold metallo-hydrolase [Candidatus Lokiarchaeota archaeon]
MKITFIGTAGSLLTADRSYPSILINQDLLLDCGEGTTQKLLKIGAIKHVNRILLTHLHNDHFMGIFSLLWYYWLSGRKQNLEIIGPPKTQFTINKILDLIHTTEGMRSSFDLQFVELEDTNELQALNKGYKIKAMKVKHSITGFAYRIEDQGKSLCYSGDTAPTQNLIKLANECDLLIGESTFPSQFKRIAHKYGHSTPSDLAELASTSRTKRIAMVHIASHYLDQIENFKAQAQKEFKGEIIIAKDLMELTL